MMVNNRVLITIILISGLGVVAIPFGNPNLFNSAGNKVSIYQVLHNSVYDN